MKLILLPLLLLLTFPAPPNGEEKIMISRIRYIMQLKASLGQQYWPGFNAAAGNVPLLYFTDAATYAANPAPRFITKFRPVPVYSSAQLNIYRTPQRINSQPFLMSTGMDLLDTTVFNYREPYMFCSSLEAVKKVIPDVVSTEEWSAMVLHEYFHGFQFRHRPLLRHYLKHVLPVTADSLNRIYRENDWFKKMTDEENALLLQAIGSTDTAATHTYIRRFLEKRKEKRAMFRKKLHYDIRNYENFYEKTEGSARYVECQLLNSFRSLPADSTLQLADTSYTANEYFKDFQLAKNQWLYETSRSANYVYATGFNMARLLDKLKRPYKQQLFNNAATGLDELLARP